MIRLKEEARHPRGAGCQPHRQELYVGGFRGRAGNRGVYRRTERDWRRQQSRKERDSGEGFEGEKVEPGDISA